MRLSTFLVAVAFATGAAAAEPPPPVPVERVMPEYPAIAWPEQITGKAEVRSRVAADGYVDRVDIISETPRGYAFGHAALEGARRWRFQPGRPGTYSIKMNFAPPSEAPVLNLSRVPGGPKPIERNGKLRYPAKARDFFLSGVSRIVFRVGGDGSVDQTWVNFEFPEKVGFGETAAEWVKEMRFASADVGIYWTDVGFRIGSAANRTPGWTRLWTSLPELPAPIHYVATYQPRAGEKALVLRLAVIVHDDGTVDPPIFIDLFNAKTGNQISQYARQDWPPIIEAVNAVYYWRFADVPAGVYRLDLAAPATE